MFVIITFENLSVQVNAMDIEGKEEFDIDFNGEMLIRFQRQSDQTILAINGVNGYGYNIVDEIKGKAPVITEIETP